MRGSGYMPNSNSHCATPYLFNIYRACYNRARRLAILGLKGEALHIHHFQQPGQRAEDSDEMDILWRHRLLIGEVVGEHVVQYFHVISNLVKYRIVHLQWGQSPTKHIGIWREVQRRLPRPSLPAFLQQLPTWS